MKLQIYHTVNAGLYLWNGRSGLLIDALHGGKRVGFSDTPQKYIGMMRRKEQFFRQDNDLLFTHTHEDHYDGELVQEFLVRNPDSLIYAPGLDRSKVQSVLLEKNIRRIRMRDYIIYAFSTEHDGKKFAGEPHNSYLVCSGEQSLWVGGDAVLYPEFFDQVKGVFPDGRICAAFVMVYQLGGRHGREFLRRLSPERLYLYHLPYPEDDVFLYCRMAEDMMARCGQEGLPVRKLSADTFL